MDPDRITERRLKNPFEALRARRAAAAAAPAEPVVGPATEPVVESIAMPSADATEEASTLEEKGEEGEQALADWFDAHHFSHVPICQNRKTFARMFAGAVKRPDFLLLFDSLGLIAVDAKNLTPYQPNAIAYYSIPLEDELKKAIAFERMFRMPVWYAVMAREADTTLWYWISALKAVEVGYLKHKADGTPFLSIKRDHFVPIRSGEDMARLYGQRLAAPPRAIAGLGL